MAPLCAVEDSFPLASGSPIPLASGFSPQTPVDYVALRSERMGAVPWRAAIDDEHGKPCATASDTAACLHRLAQLRELTSCVSAGADAFYEDDRGGVCAVRYVVYTRGDTVALARSPEEVISFLGSIDTKEEAFFLADRAGFWSTCQTKPKFRATDDGFDLLMQEGDLCPSTGGVVSEVVVHVDPRGTTSVAARKKLYDLSPCAY